MNLKIKDIIRFAILLAITGVIVWYLFRDLNWQETLEYLQTFDYGWILLSIGIGLLSHFVRAWRWQLLLEANGQKVSLLTGFFAVMVGYLVNSAVPRLGEITRCGIMNRKEGTPFAYAIGTVVSERIIDLFMLLSITFFTFVLQFGLLEDYFLKGQNSLESKLASSWWLGLILLIVGVSFLWLWRKGKFNHIPFFKKIEGFLLQGIEGLRSLKNIRNKKGFWLSTLLIWALYYFMLYLITKGSQETSNLSILAGLSILVMGSFGMASPTPNGIGAFHALVAGVLVLYGIEYNKGIIIATILHTSQFITVLVFGSLSLILVNLIKNKNIERNRAEDKDQATTSPMG